MKCGQLNTWKISSPPQLQEIETPKIFTQSSPVGGKDDSTMQRLALPARDIPGTHLC
jgi:hypothetical protein